MKNKADFENQMKRRGSFVTFSSPSKKYTYVNYFLTSGLYYKHITVVNYDSSVINKCVASLSDDARVIIYDRHVFVVQATAFLLHVLLTIPPEQSSYAVQIENSFYHSNLFKLNWKFDDKILT